MDVTGLWARNKDLWVTLIAVNYTEAISVNSQI